MNVASDRTFPLDRSQVPFRHMIRAIAAVLAVVLAGNSVALAADAPKAKTAMDPAKLKQTLTARGLGKGVKVTELDGTAVVGILTSIQDDGFQVAPKGSTQSVTIQDANVKAIHNSGLSTGAKIGIGIGIGAAAVVLYVVIAVATGPRL
jgi:hypothetical protein